MDNRDFPGYNPPSEDEVRSPDHADYDPLEAVMAETEEDGVLA